MVETTDIDLQEHGIDEPADGPAPQFGDETRQVNALRARSLWLRGSVRLLSDLIEVTKDPVPGLESDRDLIMRASLASPVLLRSLSLKPNRDPRSAVNTRKTRPHRVWVTAAPGLNAPVEALTHILAHAITEQFGEPTAVVTFSNKGLDVFWRTGGKGTPVRRGDTMTYATGAAMRKVDNPELSHHFFVAPSGVNLAVALGDLFGRMHRIVYLTNEVPDEMPRHLFPLLYKSVRRRILRYDPTQQYKARITWTDQDEGPFFSSFVASSLKRPDRERFSTEAVDGEFDGQFDRRPSWRVDRDHCRVHFGLTAIRNVWRSNTQGPEEKCESLFEDERLARVARRWARAVTNRSVGLALSGGGASSYAFVPLIRALHAREVPIDMVSGVSGGAFLGAFYCKNQLQGLQDAMEAGWLYQLGLLPNALVAEIGRGIVDYTLGKTWMGETEIKFVPVTIKLKPSEQPSAHRVVSGTLGEAVQVSGAAPMLFAPVIKLGADGPSRFADGGMAMLIPARILRDQGADLLFASNCLPSPESSNPLRYLPGGDVIYSLPFIGGAIDLWMSAAYMQGRLSRSVNPDVSGFFQVKAEKAPLLKSFFFAAADMIVEQAELDNDYAKTGDEFRDRWLEFAAPPRCGGGKPPGRRSSSRKKK